MFMCDSKQEKGEKKKIENNKFLPIFFAYKLDESGKENNKEIAKEI